MINLLEGISFEGIVQSGEIYVFTESENRLNELDGLDIIYTIRSDDELKEALEMEVFVVVPEACSIKNIRKFLGWNKLSDDCYKFSFSCIPEGVSRREVYSLCLQRMLHFRERLRWVLDDFPVPENYPGRRE